MRTIQLAVILFLCNALLTGAASAATREDCRTSTDQEHIIQCIEQGIYDPCDDDGGSWGRAQCAGAHYEIAERKVMKAEKEIASRLKNGKVEREALSKFQLAQKQWRAFRETYCQFTNQADDLSQFEGGTYFHAGYCWRRLTEERVNELQEILRRNN